MTFHHVTEAPDFIFMQCPVPMVVLERSRRHVGLGYASVVADGRAFTIEQRRDRAS